MTSGMRGKGDSHTGPATPCNGRRGRRSQEAYLLGVSQNSVALTGGWRCSLSGCNSQRFPCGTNCAYFSPLSFRWMLPLGKYTFAWFRGKKVMQHLFLSFEVFLLRLRLLLAAADRAAAVPLPVGRCWRSTPCSSEPL